MRIREATGTDVEAIVIIGRQTWPETYRFAGDDYIANGLATWWSAEAIERGLRDTTMLVAEDDDGALLGIGNIDLRRATPIIWRLYVLPQAQGSGAGTALITELLSRAPGKPVRLEYVDGNERAARFYRRRGFTEVGREPGERAGWPETVWMARPGKLAAPAPGRAR